MRTWDDAYNTLNDWLEEEFGNGIDEDGRLGRIAWVYSQYRDEATVDEQWYVNLDTLRVFLELNDEIVIVHDFYDYDELVDYIEHTSFNELIGEADGYIELHMDEYKEV